MPNRRNFLSVVGGTVVAGGAVVSNAQKPETGSPSYRGAGYAYRQPVLAEGSRLVFIGDSITDMKWGRNEKDRNHYLGHSYVYLIASRLGVDQPTAKLEFFNRGHSGNRLSDLKQRWEQDVIQMSPDLLSVLVGVNDRKVKSGQSLDFEGWEANYRDVLQRSRMANPELRIVLIEPFVLKTGWWMNKGGEWKISRKQIERMGEIVAKLTKEFSAVHVPMQSIFDQAAKAVGPEQWIWDGVHPLPQGHELIARHWLDRVSVQLT